MAAKVINLVEYSPKGSDIFFFDNNIWMYLFCPLGNYNLKKQKFYSNFLKDISTSKSTIFISSLVLSEFCNRYLRMDFEQWKNTSKKFSADFKNDYIGTETYKDTVSEIKRNVNQILSICEKSPDNFNALNIEYVFNHFNHIDFNDSYYLELAKKGNWKIVTDDGDFINYKEHSVEVVTITS